MDEPVAELAEVVAHVAPVVVFRVAGIDVTSTVVNTWILMILMFFAVYMLTKDLRTNPTRSQAVLESAFEFLYDIIDEAMGRAGRIYLPLIGTNFMLIVVLNLSWLVPGMLPPTTDLSTTLALAVTTIVMIQVITIRRKGFREHLRHFLRPMPIMLPMNLLEEFVRPLGLALRLFGNLFGGEMVMVILAVLLPLLLPVPVMLLELLMGIVQAFVFTVLTATYLSLELNE